MTEVVTTDAGRGLLVVTTLVVPTLLAGRTEDAQHPSRIDKAAGAAPGGCAVVHDFVQPQSGPAYSHTRAGNAALRLSAECRRL